MKNGSPLQNVKASLLKDGAKNPHRSNDRCLIVDPARASWLTERLRAYLPARWPPPLNADEGAHEKKQAG